MLITEYNVRTADNELVFITGALQELQEAEITVVWHLSHEINSDFIDGVRMPITTNKSTQKITKDFG